MPQGKKYKAAVATYDVESFFEPQAALAKVKSMATAKFDETIDLAVRLGLDPRKADDPVVWSIDVNKGRRWSSTSGMAVTCWLSGVLP